MSRHHRRLSGWAVAVVMALLLWAPSLGADEMPPPQSAGEERQDDGNGGEADEESIVDDAPGEAMGADGGRQTLETMNRNELEEQGFVFEEMLTQRDRAHATIFALTAGAVVPGAGHWHLDDRSTALTLVAVDLTALTMIATGVGLAVRPTGQSAVDNRRHDLWYLGAGLLGTSWLVDIFGTAFRDDLGVPTSTQRQRGVGADLYYQFYRPDNLSMRHVAAADITARSRHFEVEAHIGQELALGMSDYRLQGRWYPFMGASPQTRLGIGVDGGYRQYRLDDPFRRVDGSVQLHGSLNLGRIAGHLDAMTAGMSVGLALRSYRHLQEDGRWDQFESGQWRVPAELYLALNLTDQLRLRTGFERATGHWLEQSRTRIGIPTATLTYRSTDRLDLRFFTAFGDGLGLGGGLRMWFGE